jgi:hypothetical protein
LRIGNVQTNEFQFVFVCEIEIAYLFEAIRWMPRQFTTHKKACKINVFLQVMDML